MITRLRLLIGILCLILFLSFFNLAFVKKLAPDKREIKALSSAKPQILLESALFDFGLVNSKLGRISKVLKIDNKGKAGLIITNLKTSCSCVNVSLRVGGKKSPYFSTQDSGPLWQFAIAPGEAADLEISLDLNHSSIKPGIVMREIFIASNDPLNPQLGIIVKAQVK